MSAVEETVPLTHAAGLHARPAVKLTKLAKQFSASISIAVVPTGPCVDAKSIVRVMAMKVRRDVTLRVRAEGDDAAAAVAAVVSLVRRNFDEGGVDEGAGSERGPGEDSGNGQGHAGPV